MDEDRVARALEPVNLEALYRTHVRPLYAFVCHRVGNREAAEDITGDVFMKALTHLDLARGEHSAVAWLYQVARHAVADYWRASAGARITVLEEERLARQGRPLPDGAHQEQAAARARAVLDGLPERYRTVLSYRLLEGLTVAATARHMGLSEANVKVLQHRALKRAADLRWQETPAEPVHVAVTESVQPLDRSSSS